MLAATRGYAVNPDILIPKQPSMNNATDWQTSVGSCRAQRRPRTIRDATAATRQMHQRLQQLLEAAGPQLRALQLFKLEQDGEAVGDHRSAALALTATATHEINNPLEAIESLIYLLENEGTLNEEDRKHLATIKGEVGRIAEIVQQSLANYRQTLVREDINVAELIDSVLDLYKPKFKAKGIAVSREYQFRGNIRVHSRQIREVFANLFLNAIDAMNPAGHLRIKVSEAREWSWQQRDGVRIVVGDNGHGVAPKHLNKIFEPSFTTKGERGNGIGLSVVRDVIQGHRGTVRVRSSTRPGRSGTIFSIFLPGKSHSKPRAA
jgi:signal transduction histidine kinase